MIYFSYNKEGYIMNEQEEVFVPKKRKNNNNRKNRRKNKSVRINDINVVEVDNKKETINDKKIKNSIEKPKINDFQIVDVKKDAIEEKINNNINDLMTKANMQESKKAKVSSCAKGGNGMGGAIIIKWD